MKILLYFFARYLLAPLFVAVMIFVLTGIKTIKSKLSLKKLIIFILLASIAVALPSLFGFLKNELPDILIDVTAVPGSEDRSTRRRELPKVVP